MSDPTPNNPAIVPPPGFKEIAQSLTRDQPSPVTIEAPQEVRPPNLLVGPTMAILSATQISQDEVTVITYMDTITTSVGWVALENTHMVANLREPVLEDVTDITKLWMADDHPK